MKLAWNQSILELDKNRIRLQADLSLKELDAFLLQQGQFIPYFSFPGFNQTVERLVLEGCPGFYGRKFGPAYLLVEEIIPTSLHQAAYQRLIGFLRRFQREILTIAPQAILVPALPIWQLEGQLESDLKKVFWGSRGRLGSFEVITLRTFPRPTTQALLLGRFDDLSRFALAHPYLLKKDLDVYGFDQSGPLIEIVAGYLGDFRAEERLLRRLYSVRRIVEEFGGEVQSLKLSQIPARLLAGGKKGSIAAGLLPERLPAALIDLNAWLGSRGIFYQVTGNADQGYFSVRSPSQIDQEVAEIVLGYNGLIDRLDLLPSMPRQIFQQLEKILLEDS